MNFWELLVGIFIGLVTGGISSFIVWFIVYHVLVPRIEFSDCISKIAGHDGEPVYRIKFENSGRRPAIDIKINIRYGVKRTHNKHHRWMVTYIPFSKDRREQIPFLNPLGKNQKGMREVIPLLINDTTFEENTFPDKIRAQYELGKLTLEDLFSVGHEHGLQVFVFCYDSFSGTRKIFKSKVYTASDIKQGKFERNGLKIAAKALYMKEVEKVLENA
jgi:hypothetical protein